MTPNKLKMMKRYCWILILIFSIFFVISIKGQANNWKTIKVIESSRSDVERILGKPTENSDEIVAFFYLKEGKLTFLYSTGLCKPNQKSGWNVAEGVVDQITYFFSNPPKFKSLKINKKKLKKTIEGDVLDVFTYINEVDGVKYIVQKGLVETIVYFPNKKYESLRCNNVDSPS